MHDAGLATFDRWVDDRELHTIGTNHRSRPVAFQGWQKFKEAFAPELISRAVAECGRSPRRVLDPFGGSGTTGLASQFLGLDSVLVEVNPYLADLIEAKLKHYDLDALRRDVSHVASSLTAIAADPSLLESRARLLDHLPPTFIEPGVNSRWIFSRRLGGLFASALDIAHALPNVDHSRLIRVVVGGTLVPLSNVRVSGKGRRYRSGWRGREVEPSAAVVRIIQAINDAVDDIERFQPRKTTSYQLIRGDSRSALVGVTDIDVAVFSPPYPNSFDYTDVYNVELWMLGYLTSAIENRRLRSSTLVSHLQIRRDFAPPPTGSSTLDATLSQLGEHIEDLWDRQIPPMVGAYFTDMLGVLRAVHGALSPEGEAWIVVGDSRYSGVDVRVAEILVELAPSIGFETIRREPFRSMRASPQQGGALELAESLIVLRKTVAP